MSCIREADTVARFGGDEFVVMLTDLNPNALEAAAQTRIVAEKIRLALNQFYRLNNALYSNTPSIGITLFGEQAEKIDAPLTRADLALYQAKGAGGNTLRFFAPRMQTEVAARVALEAALRQAVLKQQFVLHYQAQVSGQGQVTGAEALLRWDDPQLGLVLPTEFISMAEKTGLILPLGRWVLETACQQLAQWAKRPDLAHLTLAVNVSSRQFRQADFVEQVLGGLERSGARPDRLKIELTESLLIVNVEDVIAKMNLLQSRGIAFSLDDFGTGYSSLAYLKRLPLDQLKIDQGFVQNILLDPNDAAIAKMVIALAQTMGLKVIAEGVETQAQRDFLADLGCHNYQGYLFGHALPIQDFEKLLRSA
jgi:EAL domain-containing protein (putative c-di-GMP-specific phosphodiesterase class I)